MSENGEPGAREASREDGASQRRPPATQPAQAGGRDKAAERRALDRSLGRMKRKADDIRAFRAQPSDDPTSLRGLANRLQQGVRREARDEILKAANSEETRPTLNFKEARAWAILSGRDARFDIKDNPKANREVRIWRHHAMGVDTVRRYSNIIEKEAKQYGLDPDLNKAIIYVENADGNFLGLNKAAEDIGLAKTILPMNINARIWSGMGGIEKREFRIPEKNIRAGAALIAAIRDRLDPRDRTPVKIGSIWHNLSLENTDGIGAEIQKAFDKKSWTR